ncbi:MAG: prepilin-type N-terminal cleavage/methylation domain-containing protein [Helicobacteraceae bacterium]|jgi:prepilin-type N-terminal cleavage/methylation domain-containing protein|nr:prepilin-type N-terminal cleavage/methylation domain-containing protein [Helicobacteraceae bacterium]
MRKAFTVIEIVIVVVIVGILSVLAIQAMYRPDHLSLAQEELILRLRYTQHLAVMVDKFDSNDTEWKTKRWRFHCDNGSLKCSVFAPSAALGVKASVPNLKSDFAIDPQTRNYLTGGYGAVSETDERAMPELALRNFREIEDISLSGCGTGADLMIVFDEIGRPYAPDGANPPKLLASPCVITLTHQEDKENAKVCIQPETGRVHNDC